MVQGVLETGQVDGTQYAVPDEHQRQEHRLLRSRRPEAAGGYQIRRDLRRPPVRDRRDRGDRDDAVVLRHRVRRRPPGGRPPTGWRTSILVQHGPDFYNQWVNHEIPFNDARGPAGAGRDGDDGARRRPCQRRPAVDRQQQLRYRCEPDVRRPAGLLHVPAGQLRRAGGRASPTRSSPTSTTSSASSRCRVRRPRTSRCSAAATSPASSRRTTTRPRSSCSSSPRQDFGTNGYGASGNWISPRTDFDVSLYPTEIWRQHREHRLRVDGVRLRRLRPDAR